MSINNTHRIVFEYFFEGKHWFFHSILRYFLHRDTDIFFLLSSYVLWRRNHRTGIAYPTIPFSLTNSGIESDSRATPVSISLLLFFVYSCFSINSFILLLLFVILLFFWRPFSVFFNRTVICLETEEMRQFLVPSQYPVHCRCTSNISLLHNY